PVINVGETVEVEGEWINHPQYGYQFNASEYSTVYPVTVSGIEKFLGSGIIKGIGPVTAKKIVEFFELETLDIIEHQIERLKEVDNIGKKRIGMIRNGWEEHRSIKDVMLFLSSHNISTTLAVKIFNKFGKKSINIIRSNPYQLIYHIYGIGFATADKIAQDMGIDRQSMERVKAGLNYILVSATEEGHVYLIKDELIKRGIELLALDIELIEEGIKNLIQEKRIICEKDSYFTPPLYRAEVLISIKLKRMLSNPVQMVQPDIFSSEMEKIERMRHINFSERQRDAVIKSVNNRVLVITGGPGTGKTTAIKGIIDFFKYLRMRVTLGAPTGRAAKKLEETTGVEAKTIHRLLEFNPADGKFARNDKNPLSEDVIIIDEGSMIDTYLLSELLNGISVESRLIIVGDADQLPSVGPGNVLKDIISSGSIEVVKLKYIFRQEEHSDIISNAHRINQGEKPLPGNRIEDNFFFIEEEDVSQIPEIIKDLCTKRLPNRYKFDPFEDIQVLTPMYKGDTGALNLNNVLQDALNPKGRELRRGEKLFRVGDKVMQIRNNYDKDVFNGDIGKIKRINIENQEVVVGYYSRNVLYDFRELDDIVLAYATTVHKSQGSEYKAVIIPLTTQHYVMLQRNLFYTALTRAKELFVLVGTWKAVNIAVKNDKVSERYTSLAGRL
ncbi:ATP-dependent RecD-like DNA helicase, partial [bacterium]|nr:ATP-dependent RecD-like DNA helicase [bacterium]